MIYRYVGIFTHTVSLWMFSVGVWQNQMKSEDEPSESECGKVKIFRKTVWYALSRNL